MNIINTYSNRVIQIENNVDNYNCIDTECTFLTHLDPKTYWLLEMH